MRFHLGIVSKAKRFFFSSHSKKKTSNGENPVGDFDSKSNPVVDYGLDYSSRDFGGKDETFFDTRVWLDSDCEDDFYSVNGDFTPSRGSTPNHQITTPQLNKPTYLPTFPDTNSEPSPTDGKKKLFDLLQETQIAELAGNEQNVETNGSPSGYTLKTDHPPRSMEGTPYLTGTNSVCSSEVTPGRDSKRPRKACCFPSLFLGAGFGNRRKKKMSPGY